MPDRRQPLRRLLLASLAALSLLGGCGDERPVGEGAGGAGGAGGAAGEYPAPYDAEGTWRGPRAPTPPKPRPDIVVVVMDEVGGALPGVFTGDGVLVGGWGDHVVLLGAVTPAPEPAAALASLLTGRLPSRHQVSHRDPVPALHRGYATLPEILKAHGYATRAFVARERLAKGTSLWQGFELETQRVGLQEAPDALARWVATLLPTQPYFALVHADEATAPYGKDNHQPRTVGAPPPLPLGGGAAAHAHLYLHDRAGFGSLRAFRRSQGGEAAVAELDREVLRFLWQPQDPSGPFDRAAFVEEAVTAHERGVAWVDGLASDLEQRANQLRPTGPVTVWTSTGGPGLGSHGSLGPGRWLYDEHVHVPLIFGGIPETGHFEESASLCDVLPTLLDVLGLPPPQDLDGVSIRPASRLEKRRAPVVSEATQDPENTGLADVRVNLVSVRSPRWKYIVRFDVRQGTVVEEAYDLAADPGEAKNLADADGTVSKVPFDAEMCAAVEHVRDGLWGVEVAGSNAVAGGPYSMGARVATNRPRPVCR